ncbi:hypothetical protein [Negadavirga shengliensis]|uniref:Glycosyltransferase n=1 Tax=Negadavirga shengliensis TaxID=1389218 RepID=A0ABV9T330_9BACT
MGKKIVWILHNKGSHHRQDNKLTDYMFQVLMKRADRIITHSESGLDFVRENYPEAESKTEVIIHPVGEVFDNPTNSEKQYDFLIWGTVFPYKGIDKFLKYIKENSSLHHFKVLIIGKCPDKDYKNELLKMMSDNVTFYDKFFELNEIATFSSLCKFTLFTYNSVTVISSGTLIDAIRMNSIIIGPNHGAFRDIGNHFSFVKTYDSFDDIFEIAKVTSENTLSDDEERMNFCKTNSWPLFIDKLHKVIT